MPPLPPIDPQEVDNARTETYLNIIRNLTNEIAMGQALITNLRREFVLRTEQLENVLAQLHGVQSTDALPSGLPPSWEVEE